MQITVPEIAETVSRSQQYNRDPQNRIEATRSFLKSIILKGPDSLEGNQAIETANAVHHRLSINPQSPAFAFVLYTLSTEFIRSLRENSAVNPSFDEELALFKLVRRVGEKMGTTTGMMDYQSFIAANEEYRNAIWGLNASLPRTVAHQMLHSGLKRFPGASRRLASSVLLSLVGEPVLGQLELPHPSNTTRRVVR